MTVPARSGQGAPDRRVPRGTAILGWIGVGLATLLSAFFAMFAGGETLSEGVSALGHYVQTLAVIAVGMAALTRPRVGAVYTVMGLLFTWRFWGGVFPIALGAVLVVTGICLYYGRVESRKLAYRLLVGVPLVVAVVTGLLAESVQ